MGQGENRAAVSSLIFARVVYAVNWLNVGPIFVLMSADLGAAQSGLGTLTSAFYLGIGLMQIPGGLFAARWGPKRVVAVGIFLSSFSVIGTSVLSNIAEISVLRFLVGTGMAFVFAPGVVLVAHLFAGGKFGLGVGLFNSAFDFGGVAGIFGWVLIATAFGWRPSLALGGVLGVLTGVLVLVYVPRDEGRGDFKVETKALLSILRDRRLVLLGLGTIGFGVGNVVISTFMVSYLVNAAGYSPALAALVDSMVVGVPVFTAIWGGRIYDRSSKKRLIMVLSLVGSSVALVFGAFPNIYSAFACSTLGGVVSGVGYTFAFAGARDLNTSVKQYDTIAIGWVNSISLTGTFGPPLLFSYLVEAYGYTAAWLGSAAFGLVFLVPLVLIGEWTGR